MCSFYSLGSIVIRDIYICVMCVRKQSWFLHLSLYRGTSKFFWSYGFGCACNHSVCEIIGIFSTVFICLILATAGVVTCRIFAVSFNFDIEDIAVSLQLLYIMIFVCLLETGICPRLLTGLLWCHCSQWVLFNFFCLLYLVHMHCFSYRAHLFSSKFMYIVPI